ncbi:nucleotidyltransferase family protein [Elongatibacter sediminis]|uniref:Nucleotidyltransferase family protein n=1 Tax=Elongatibacter sediminis TaxID=3119006 RepID=A0AAW9R762_9GAMM
MSSTSPHVIEFIAAALRGAPASWASLQPSVSEQEFLDCCRHHGVQGVLFHALAESGTGHEWPDGILTVLEEECREFVAAELLRGHHLVRISEALGQRGIRHILMKGEALAQTHYAQPGSRVRGDTDLFIHLHDIGRVRSTLTDAGYKIVPPVYKTHQFTVTPAAGKGVGVWFDVHWRILNSPRYALSFDFEDAYAQATKMDSLESASVLSAEHNFLVACMHRDGSDRHDRNRLIWLYDIHLLFSALGQEGQMRVCRLANSLNLQECCRDGLERAARLFRTRVTSELLELLSPAPEPVDFRWRFSHSSLGLLRHDWYSLQGWGDRRRLLGELFLPSGKSLLARYGKEGRQWLPWLYVRQISSGVANRLRLR